MTEFYTVKKIDNSRLVRPASPRRLRECCCRVAAGALLASCLLLYAWQHFQCIQLRYQLEDLQNRHARAFELNQELRLEIASLRSPLRIDAIARHELGLTVAGQVMPTAGPSETVLAQVHLQSPTPRP